jgi:hypothetical protein
MTTVFLFLMSCARPSVQCNLAWLVLNVRACAGKYVFHSTGSLTSTRPLSRLLSPASIREGRPRDREGHRNAAAIRTLKLLPGRRTLRPLLASVCAPELHRLVRTTRARDPDERTTPRSRIERRYSNALASSALRSQTHVGQDRLSLTLSTLRAYGTGLREQRRTCCAVPIAAR